MQKNIEGRIRYSFSLKIANKTPNLVAEKKFNRQLEELITGEEIKANVINAILRMKRREDHE